MPIGYEYKEDARSVIAATFGEFAHSQYCIRPRTVEFYRTCDWQIRNAKNGTAMLNLSHGDMVELRDIFDKILSQ